PTALADVQAQGHDRLALLLRPTEQLVDLRAAEEELAGALGLVVGAVALLERGDMGADQPRFAALDARVGIGEVDLARPDGLDLGPGQHEAGLERLVDGVFVAGSAVEGDRLLAHRWLLRRSRERSAAVRVPGARTPALCGPAFEAVHRAGCPLRRPSPARWCSYAYCRSLHITSFRSG